MQSLDSMNRPTGPLTRTDDPVELARKMFKEGADKVFIKMPNGDTRICTSIGQVRRLVQKKGRIVSETFAPVDTGRSQIVSKSET